MISRNLYINIVIRILLLVILSAFLGYSLFKFNSLRISFLCSLAIVFLTISLISYLNSTNKKISNFFDSVRNDDTSLYFPVVEKDKNISAIYRSMNKVNQQIQQLKIENRQQEKYFQIMLEHLATGIITYDKNGYILHANSSAKRVLSIDSLTHLNQLERFDQKLYQSITTIKPLERRLIAINTDKGEIQLLLKATSIKTIDNELIILSIQDIKSELDEKEIESWMKLIRVLMHEIMNSITPITSLSESLYDLYSKDGNQILPEQLTSKVIDTTLQGLNVIKEQGKGLILFVESYRRLTRVPEPKKSLFRVADLMSRIDVLYDSLEKSNKKELSFSLKDPDLKIFADQNLISQVLINLVKNAHEANENNPDGKIVIEAGIDDNHHPTISVIDNGPGISEENLDEIFVPFFTTRQKGSGIGLSISRQIMRVHGGSLKVRSVPGRETVFCLTFLTEKLN